MPWLHLQTAQVPLCPFDLLHLRRLLRCGRVDSPLHPGPLQQPHLHLHVRICHRNGNDIHYRSLLLRIARPREVLPRILRLCCPSYRRAPCVVGIAPDLPRLYRDCRPFPLRRILSVVHCHHCSCLSSFPCFLTNTSSYTHTFFANSQTDVAFSKGSYLRLTTRPQSHSNWNCPRFTSTVSSFSKLTTGKSPPRYVTSLHIALPILTHVNATPKSFPFLEKLSVRLSASSSTPTTSPGQHTSPYASPSASPCHFRPRATSASHVSPTPTKGPAGLAVADAVLRVLVTAVVAPAPPHLHQPLRQHVELEVVAARHYRHVAQPHRRETRLRCVSRPSLAHPSRSRRPAASPTHSAAAAATQTPHRCSTPHRARPTSPRSSSSSSRADRSPGPLAAAASSSGISPRVAARDPPPPPSSHPPPCCRSSRSPRCCLAFARNAYASFSFSFFRRSCSRRKAARPSPVSSSSPCAKSHWSRRGQPQCLSALGGTVCHWRSKETFPLVRLPPPLAHLLLLLLAEELAARPLHAFRPRSQRERDMTSRGHRSTSRTRLPLERPSPRPRYASERDRGETASRWGSSPSTPPVC